MSPDLLVAAVSLTAGGALVLLAAWLPGPGLRTRLRIVDGVHAETRRRRHGAWLAGSAVLGLLTVPVLALVSGPPAVGIPAAVLALPVLAAVVAELRAAPKGRMPGRVPLLMGWQRRLAERLATAVTAALPAPRLRPPPRHPRSVPALSAPGTSTRLLVIRAARTPSRTPLSEVAEEYLGSRSRVREIVALNAERRGPHGEPIDEATRVGRGWALLMPPDAIGAGLIEITGVDAPAPRIPADDSPLPTTAAAGPPATGASAAGPLAPSARNEGGPTPVEALDGARRPAPRADPPPPVGAVAEHWSATTRPMPVVPPAPATARPDPPAPTEPAARAEPVVAARLADVGTAAAAVPAEPAAGAGRTAAGRPTGGPPPVPTPPPAGPEPPAEAVAGASPAPSSSAPVQRGAPDLAPSRASAGPHPARADRFPPALLPWDLGHARLLADGLGRSLATLRSHRDRERRYGEAVVPLGPAASAVRAVVDMGADTDGAVFLDRALRLMAAARPGPAPAITHARLSAESLEVVLRHPIVDAPAPFAALDGGRRWQLSRDRALSGEPGSPPFPGLVSVGRDEVGTVLVDLGSAPGPVCILGAPHATALVALALGLEASTKRWSDPIAVTMVGFGVEPVHLDPRLRWAPDLDTVLDGVTEAAAANRRAPAEHGAGAAAAQPGGSRGPARLTQLLVLASPPSGPRAAALLRLAGATGGAGLGVVVAGDWDGAGWRFLLDERGLLSLPDLGVRVGAQALAVSTVDALAELAAAERTSLAADPDPAGPAPAPRFARVPPSGVVDVVVRLFGTPRIDTADGSPVPSALVVELVAFLALRNGCTQTELAQALWPAGAGDRQVSESIARARAALGRTADGRPRLVVHGSGWISLTEDVHTDWQVFVVLAAAGWEGAAIEQLGAGLAEERGAEAPFSWLAGEPVSRALPAHVADVIHGFARLCSDRGRPDLAVAVAELGLRVQPSSSLLAHDLQAGLSSLRPVRTAAGPQGHRSPA